MEGVMAGQFVGAIRNDEQGWEPNDCAGNIAEQIKTGGIRPMEVIEEEDERNPQEEAIRLAALANRYPKVPRIALTATADAITRKEIIERLHLRKARSFVSSFDRPNIRYRIVAKAEAKPAKSEKKE